MPSRLTKKQEDFAFNIAVNFNETSATAIAIKVGYSKKTAHVIASENMRKPNIVRRIEEHRNDLNGPDILSKREYLAQLTGIARTKITDFQTCGADGSYIDIGPEHPNAGSVQEITSRTDYDKDGTNASVITKVKLHSPLEAGRDIAKVKGWTQSDQAAPPSVVQNFVFLLPDGTRVSPKQLQGKTEELPSADNS